MKRTTKIHRKVSDSYLELIHRHPLKAIRTIADYDAAAAIIDELAIRDEHSLDVGEQEYLDALSTLVEAYDRQHRQDHLPTVGPKDMLNYFLKEKNLTSGNLAEHLNCSRSNASMMIRGHRGIGKENALKLARLFEVGVELFL